MKYTLIVQDQAGDEDVIDVENPLFVPAPGDIITRSVRASSNLTATSAGVFKVISRKVQYLEVGGSEPTGSEDTCAIFVYVEPA